MKPTPHSTSVIRVATAASLALAMAACGGAQSTNEPARASDRPPMGTTNSQPQSNGPANNDEPTNSNNPATGKRPDQTALPPSPDYGGAPSNTDRTNSNTPDPAHGNTMQGSGALRP